MAKMNKYRSADLLQLVLAVAIVILVNVIGNYLYTRFDLTSEKRYTLSPATKNIVTSLEDVVYVKVYLDDEATDLPAGLVRLKNSTREMLEEFRALNRENIQFDFIDPNENPEKKAREDLYRQLTKQGLQYTNLEQNEEGGRSETIIFPGAIMTYQNRDVPIQLLKSQIGAHPEVMLNNSVQQLEFELANAIRQLISSEEKVIAFSEGHGELSDPELADIRKELGQYYATKRVKLDSQLNALAHVDLLVVAKPDSAFSEPDKFIIDQFVMRGGRVLWLIDRTNATMDSLSRSSTTFALPNDLNLDDLLFKYGARINTNLVQDLQSAPIPIITGMVGNQPQQKLFPWYYFPLMMPVSQHPIVRNLNAVKGEFVSTVDTISRPGITKTPLLHTSRYSKVLQTPLRVSLNTLRDEPSMQQFQTSFIPVAVLLEGEFESNFRNRIPPQIAEDKSIGYKEKSVANKMIVAGDGDLIRNPVHGATGNIMPLGYDRYTNEIYGNKDFIMNAITYLLDESGLISVRSREVKLRMLDKARIKDQGREIVWINTLLPVLLIVLLGVGLFWWRRRKYTKGI